MKVYKAPQYVPNNVGHKRVFLAGSIEMGAAENWQAKVTDALRELAMPELVIFNPRRDNWDGSWEQSITNPEFNEQVTWEMDQLDRATHLFFNFCKDTKSPITLLELGMMTRYAGYPIKHEGKSIVVNCPKEFWRRGNVEMVCHRFGIQLYSNINDAIAHLRTQLQHRGTTYPGPS